MQLPLDEFGNRHYTCSYKKQALDITFSPMPLPDHVRKLVCFVIKVDKVNSFEGNVFTEYDRLSSEELGSFCKEVTKIWKEKKRRGSELSITHIEKVCAKTFGRKSLRLFRSEKSPNGLSSHVLSYLDVEPSRICSVFDSRTYYKTIKDTDTIPDPFSAKLKPPATLFE